ncbi:MAG: 6-phosphogluconolactonase [Pseudomonadota bacterium]
METTVTGETKTKLQVLPDLEAISHKAASLFVNTFRNSIATRRRFALVISGGFTPRRLYTLLSAAPYRGQVEWPRIKDDVLALQG